MAGKKFAAEFALRRNVSAQDKILIQDSDDDVVKYAYPPQIAALSGYAYAKSIADLPLMPSNKSIGYIVGQMLYIYVGMGGDTKDGLYQSVGFFVGPQGVQGEKGEQGERGEQGVQGPKGDNGGLSLQEVDAHLATKQYVTADTLAEMLAGYVSNTSLMRDYVTIAKAQDVTGVKNFTAGVQFGGLPMYKSKDDTVYLDANLVVRGAVTMYGMNTTTSPSIFSALPIDGRTIGRNERGELYVIGGTSGGGGGTGGGISITDVENYLTGNGYITSSGSITGNAATATSAQYLYQSNIQESINYPRGAEHAIKVVNCTSTKQDGFFSDYATVLSVASPLSNFQIGMYANPFVAWASHPRFRAMRNTDGVWDEWRELAFVNDLSDYLPLTGGTVNGDVTANIYYANKGFVLSNVGDEYSGLVAGSHISTVGNAKDIWLYNSSADIKVYTPTIFSVQGGNVAIGGSTATEKLHLYGNMLFEGEAALKSSLIGEVLYMSGSYLVIGGGSLAKGIPTYIDGQTVYVRAGNYVATFSDAGELTWNGNLLATGGITCRDNFRTNDNYYGFSVKSQGGEDNWYGVKTYMQFDEGSTMGVCRIGTAYRHQGLAISFSTGNAYNYNIPSDYTYTDAMLLDKNGNLKIAGAITMYYSSDKRLKQNIRKVNASKMLMSLGGIYQYEYIDSEVAKNSTYGGSHYGLIYQNVKGTALKSMCHEREDGYGSLNYVDADFISIIAGATMENISEVEKLNRKIRTLENKVKQLERVT